MFLLDEPTSSLDLKNQLEILSIIKMIVKEHRIIAVMTMHDIKLTFRFADCFLFIRKGRVHSAGCVINVTASMIRAVYGVSVEIITHDGRVIVVPGDKRVNRVKIY